MTDLDPLSERIGELTQAVKGVGHDVRELNRRFDKSEERFAQMREEGCVRGRANGHRIENLENLHATREQRDWRKIGLAATAISAAVMGIIEGLKSL